VWADCGQLAIIKAHFRRHVVTETEAIAWFVISPKDLKNIIQIE
jgi:hypothetical protein